MSEQWRFLVLHHVGDDAVAFLPRIQDVEDVAVLGAEPDDVFGRAVALHDADIGALFGLPGIRRLAAHRALHAAGDRQDRKQQMILGNDEIVHHAGVGRLEPIEPRHHARRVDGSDGEGGGQRPRRVIAEEHHLAGDRIDLGMRRERPADAALVVAITKPVQGTGLDLGRQMAFLQRQQAAAVEDDVGVGDAAVLGDVCRRIGQLAAEAAEQRAAGVMLGLPFRGADPAVAVAGAAVFEVEGVQHAVADEPVRARRLELWVGAVAIERAVEPARQLAGYFEVRRVAFHRDRRQIGPRRV